MKILKFKTNINSTDDVTKVTPHLDKEESISNWDIDTESEDKVLSVAGINLNPQKVEDAVQAAGFEAEVLRVLGIGGEGI